jgi:segregation and condensation protein A
VSYQVKLDVFQGPFDLLLHLISRRQVEITEIDLAEITQDFVSTLRDGLDELDLESATRFLVVAATLIELKAARLLPAEQREQVEDALGEVRDRLYARLLEYRAFRDVSRIISHRLDLNIDLHPRDVPLEPWMLRLVPDAPLPVDARGLAALAAAAMRPRPVPTVDLQHIRRSYLSIRDAALSLLGALPDDAASLFSDLAVGRPRGDRVVLFLALLELFKLGYVDLEQDDLAGPLVVSRRDGGVDLESLVESDVDDGSLETRREGRATDAAQPSSMVEVRA